MNSGLVDIVLHRSHTHAGCDYKPGDVIEVSKRDKDFLVKHGVAKALATPKQEKGVKNGTRT